MRIVHVLFILLVSISSLFSQYNKIWYFGLNCGLNFNTPNPTILTNGLATNYDNSSTMCDANGNLLFYTTGMTVWDKNNNVMPNGSGLVGNTTAGQCALIIPIPCSPTKYVIFHTTEFSNPGNLNYTVVDMSLNGGNGDVVTSQKNVFLGTGWTEKLCAYFNPVGNYYWVVSHKWNSDQFVAFKIDQSSIATTSVVTSIGTVHNCGTVGGAHDAMGQLTISPDGTKLINALTCTDKFELFNFDVNTGSLSNMITIPGDGNKAWGTAFSDDSKKVYVNTIFGKSVYQYDINVYVQATIVSSQFAVVTMPSTGYNFGYMELGPNNKIYVTRPNTTWLSVIGNPNSLGAACNFTLSGQSLGTQTSRWGLSRIAYNIQSSTSNLFLTVNSNSISCFGMADGSATISANPVGSYNYTWQPSVSTSSIANNLSAGSFTVTVSDGLCISTTSVVSINQPPKVQSAFSSVLDQCKGVISLNNLSNGATNYTWSVGDGNIYSNSNVTHTYALPGTYTVSLIAGNSNNCLDSLKTTITVFPQGQSALTFTYNPCDSVVLLNNLSQNAGAYLWNFGDGQMETNANPLNHKYLLPGMYHIKLITDPNAQCPDTSEVTVNVLFTSKANFSLVSNYCDREIKLKNMSNYSSSILWKFGDGVNSQLNDPTHVYNNQGTYSVTLIVNQGYTCADTMVKAVDFGNPPKADFTFKTNPCDGRTIFTNTSINATKYYWNFNFNGVTSYDTNAVCVFTKDGSYNVMLIANPGQDCSDTIIRKVNIESTSVLADFNYEVKPYTDEIQFYNMSSNAKEYLWDFNDGGTSYLKDPIHNFYSIDKNRICLSVKNELGCGDTICKDIYVKPDWTLYVPNSFTPNDDGVNDIFLAIGTNIYALKMEIFDRWGERLFVTEDISMGWNGIYKNQICKDDEYIWRIKFTDLYNKSHELTGHVLLYK